MGGGSGKGEGAGGGDKVEISVVYGVFLRSRV